MNWKFWKKAKPVEEKKDVFESGGAKIVFELVNHGQTIAINASWPHPKSNDEALELISKYSNMLLLIVSGKMTKVIQNAVGSYSDDDEIQQQVSAAIVASFRALLKQEGINHEDANTPIITPRRAFAVRGEQ